MNRLEIKHTVWQDYGKMSDESSRQVFILNDAYL